MREKMVLKVQEGGTLQLTLGNSPVGQPITIPQGVTSVTVIVRDTAGLEAARARRGAPGMGRRRKAKETE